MGIVVIRKVRCSELDVDTRNRLVSLLMKRLIYELLILNSEGESEKNENELMNVDAEIMKLLGVEPRDDYYITFEVYGEDADLVETVRVDESVCTTLHYALFVQYCLARPENATIVVEKEI